MNTKIFYGKNPNKEKPWLALTHKIYQLGILEIILNDLNDMDFQTKVNYSWRNIQKWDLQT